MVADAQFPSPLRGLAHIALGGMRFLTSGRTPDAAYQSLVSLFCQSGGRSNDWLAATLSLLHPPARLPDGKGRLGEMAGSALASVVSDLDRNGFHVFPQRLPEDLCDRLLDFALTSTCLRRPYAGSDFQAAQPVACYERDAPKAVRYDFAAQAVIDNPDVQALMADRSFLAVAQGYLRCLPVLDVMSMWWHCVHGDAPDADAAQFWHFDMDRIKWLKFFIYLTDVTADSGPHCFVRGSHRVGGLPPHLARKGYARLTDAEVAAAYPASDFMEFTAPRGTVIAEDTRGLHKGKQVFKGDRLILQLQFSNSLFGGYYPPAQFTAIRDAHLQTMVARHPRLYSNYLSSRTS